jgi:hypothetical protein
MPEISIHYFSCLDVTGANFIKKRTGTRAKLVFLYPMKFAGDVVHFSVSDHKILTLYFSSSDEPNAV